MKSCDSGLWHTRGRFKLGSDLGLLVHSSFCSGLRHARGAGETVWLSVGCGTRAADRSGPRLPVHSSSSCSGLRHARGEGETVPLSMG